jgi:hypothetical protein
VQARSQGKSGLNTLMSAGLDRSGSLEEQGERQAKEV